MDKKEIRNTVGKIVTCYIKDDETYSKIDDYLVDVLKQFINNYDNLNKGIDELINELKIQAKKYDKYIEIEPIDLYLWFIDNLKKLKGE